MANLNQIRAYYSHLVSLLGRVDDADIVAVAHMVPNTVSFAPALNGLANLAAILPKPKSKNRPEYDQLKKEFKIRDLSREWASDADLVLNTLCNDLCLGSRPLVLVDIGGYFAPSVNVIAEKLGDNLIGVLEGTENGVQKYEKVGSINVPIVTVARSPLKLPEDYLVASSLVFSIESTLRMEAEILQTRSAAVIGYGRVGSSIAEILRGRGIATVVFDCDPIKLAEAAARGFRCCRRREEALASSSLVVCATGNKALDLRGFGSLTSGCVVASTTSADDEFDLESLSKGYIKSKISDRLTMYRENRNGESGRHFLLVAGGDAANFMDGAVIGPAMQLIEGEKIAAIRALLDGRLANQKGITELGNKKTRTEDSRKLVAEIWNEHFL